MPTNHVIEVFADLWCPFTHVGLRAIDEQRILSGRSDLLIEVRSWPLELVNGAPLDPLVTQEHAVHLREQVAPTMFRNFDPTHFPHSTLEALALVVRAYRSELVVGERASFMLRDAIFEEGRDISDVDVLADVATRLGIEQPTQADREHVVADWQEGQRRGVQGSPHFFCGSHATFCPSLDITKDPVRGVSIVKDAAQLTSFLERCCESAPESD